MLKITCLINSSTVSVEKEESVSRAYLSELQNITLHLKEAKERLMTAIETPPLSRLSADGADVTLKIEAQKVGVARRLLATTSNNTSFFFYVMIK